MSGTCKKCGCKVEQWGPGLFDEITGLPHDEESCIDYLRNQIKIKDQALRRVLGAGKRNLGTILVDTIKKALGVKT